jgi:hypothetical protein
MWNVIRNVMSVITAQLEPFQNHLEHVSNIPGKHKIKELQKAAV